MVAEFWVGGMRLGRLGSGAWDVGGGLIRVQGLGFIGFKRVYRAYRGLGFQTGFLLGGVQGLWFIRVLRLILVTRFPGSTLLPFFIFGGSPC